jgi:3D (Asp-Asp-Asp) domain-containing protein
MSKSQNLYVLAMPFLIVTLLNPLNMPQREKSTAEAFFGLNEGVSSNLQIVEQNTLLPLSTSFLSKPPKTVKVIVTAYSPSECETDDTPFITASGKYVQDGFVANNSLPFGTKVRLPKIFPNKTFVVQDRMHWSKSGYFVDIMMFSREKALEFGAQYTEMEILN